MIEGKTNVLMLPKAKRLSTPFIRYFYCEGNSRYPERTG